MRAMPGLRVIRPADANETSQAWRIAVDRDGPTALILSRQEIPVLAETVDRAATGVERGAYVLSDSEGGMPDLLTAGGVRVRVVSFPSWELFAEQPDSYRVEVFPGDVPRLAVEAATSFGWERYADATVSIDHFGASAPGEIALEEFGFTAENVATHATTLLAR
jgi:transketolase